jgi:hypothetical protein
MLIGMILSPMCAWWIATPYAYALCAAWWVHAPWSAAYHLFQPMHVSVVTLLRTLDTCFIFVQAMWLTYALVRPFEWTLAACVIGLLNVALYPFHRHMQSRVVRLVGAAAATACYILPLAHRAFVHHECIPVGIVGVACATAWVWHMRWPERFDPHVTILHSHARMHILLLVGHGLEMALLSSYGR